MNKTLEERFADVTAKMGGFDLVIDPGNPESLVKAKEQLDEIILELEGFLKSGDLEDNSEKSKALLGDVSDLLSQTRVLHGHISKQTNKYSASVPTGSTQSIPDVGDNPLRRDEIAKLLLLVARAYSIKQISLPQRSFLKSEIVNRKGYLRDVVQQEDIGKVLEMLAEIADQNC